MSHEDRSPTLEQVEILSTQMYIFFLEDEQTSSISFIFAIPSLLYMFHEILQSDRHNV